MKSITGILAFLALVSNAAIAQKFGYVDSDFILKKIPEYRQAQEDLNKLSLAWQDEISALYKDIEGMYNSLQAEEVLLTKEMREERVAAIRKKESEVKEYQKKIFGFEGLFFLKKKELIK